MLAGLVAALTLGTCLDTGPAIAILIDDLGYQPRYDREAAALPQLRSFAILPFTPLARELAEELHAAGREILLHLPMEARAHNELLGPGALLSSMNEREFTATARAALAVIPYLRGVNNHMGSRLTGDPERMRWLMRVLAERPTLLFLDSRTTARSAARRAAHLAAVPYLERDVFLDHDRDAAAIDTRFDELLGIAAQQGDAIAIAHPHPETLAVLRARLPGLRAARIVTLGELFELRQCRRQTAARVRGSEPVPE